MAIFKRGSVGGIVACLKLSTMQAVVIVLIRRGAILPAP